MLPGARTQVQGYVEEAGVRQARGGAEQEGCVDHPKAGSSVRKRHGTQTPVNVVADGEFLEM